MFTFKNKTKVLKVFLALLIATQYQLSSPMMSRFLNFVYDAALKNAAQLGHLKTVKYLCENGADVNKADNNGGTPLMAAAQFGHLKTVKYLCENGAEVNKANNKGVTPLYVAAQNGHLKIVKYLCENGADVNQADNNGGTPLMVVVALGSGHSKIVEYLLQKILIKEARSNVGSNKFILNNINLTTNQDLLIQSQSSQIIACTKSTALHIACLLKNKEMIKKILLFKPDLSAQDENGKKAIDYLQENDVALINLMSHPNCHRPTNEEDNEYYNRAVLKGADNQTGNKKAFVHNPVKYNDSECFDLSFNYFNNN